MIERQGISNVTETVISGSFRKHLEQINTAHNAFQRAGISVLAPDTTSVVNPNEDFVILATDDTSLTSVRLETNFMRNIRGADFLYVVDVDGYVGKSAATEMAYAGIKGLPVIVAEGIASISDEIPSHAQSLLRNMVGGKVSLDEITKEKIDHVLEHLDHTKLSPDEERILSGVVRNLIRELSVGIS